jgi:hypothetical protein
MKWSRRNEMVPHLRCKPVSNNIIRKYYLGVKLMFFAGYTVINHPSFRHLKNLPIRKSSIAHSTHKI